MTTTSFPAVGNGGFTDAQWSTLYGGQDGIYNDLTTTGDAFALQLISTGDIARVLAPTVPTGATPPIIKVNGYGLQVTANEDFVIPNPATTTTYSLYAQYDPALNVADGSGNANPLGPVRLRLDATIDTTGGKQSVVLYTLRRTPGQAVTAITPNDYRQWYGPHISGKLIYEAPSGQAPQHPRGAVHTTTGGTTYILEPVAGVMRWVPLHYTTGTASLSYASGFSAQTGEISARYTIPSKSGAVHMTGSARRTAGGAIVSSTANADVSIATIPAEHAPANIKRFAGAYAGGARTGVVIVTPGGNIMVRPNGVTVDWIDLSIVHYQIGT